MDKPRPQGKRYVRDPLDLILEIGETLHRREVV